MKKMIVTILLICSTQKVFAEGSTLVPMVLGGVVGYVIRDKGIFNNSPEPIVLQPGEAALINYFEPIYQYKIIYEPSCKCNKKVLMRVN